MKGERVAGIDIGSSRVRVIIAESTGETSSSIIGTGSTDSRGIKNGTVVRKRDLKQSIETALHKAMESANVDVGSAIVSIGGPHIESTRITIPFSFEQGTTEIDYEELDLVEQALEKRLSETLSNREVIYHTPIEYTLDGTQVTSKPPIGLTASSIKVEYFVVTSFKQYLNDIIEILTELDIEVINYTPSSIAAAEILLSEQQKEVGCVLADIGSQTVSIIVYEDGIPRSLKVFPFGSQSITNDIAIAFKVSLEDAQDIKEDRGGKDISKQRLEQVISKRLKEIFTLINAHLESINYHHILPGGVVLSGGGAGLVAVEDIAAAILKLPAHNTAINSLHRGGIKNSSWAVSYGLTVRYFKELHGIKRSYPIVKKIGASIRNFLART